MNDPAQTTRAHALGTLRRVVVPDLESYERFLADKLTRISCVANIQSSFALKQVIYRTELPLNKN